MHVVAPPLQAWESFYVIVGSSAGALTGLQFVVLTLVAEGRRVRGSKDTTAAFGSPNVVHFCAALLVSAILSAPWDSLWHAGLSVAVCGVCGVIYSAFVFRRALRQQGYQPVLEDWIWHNILPTLAYSILLVAGGLIETNSITLFVIGGAVLLLVFIGIHNAWDTITYIVHREGEADIPAGERTQTRPPVGPVPIPIGEPKAAVRGDGEPEIPPPATGAVQPPSA